MTVKPVGNILRLVIVGELVDAAGAVSGGLVAISPATNSDFASPYSSKGGSSDDEQIGGTISDAGCVTLRRRCGVRQPSRVRAIFSREQLDELEAEWTGSVERRGEEVRSAREQN